MTNSIKRRGVAGVLSVAFAAGLIAVAGIPSAASAAVTDCFATDTLVTQWQDPVTKTMRFTTDESEARVAGADGLTRTGYTFRASSKPAPGLTGIYYIQHPTTKDNAYVRSEAEAVNAVAKWGYVNKGVEFYASTTKLSTCNSRAEISSYGKGPYHQSVLSVEQVAAAKAAGWGYANTFYAPNLRKTSVPAVSPYPDATTTGVPSDVKLTVHEGDIVVTQPNTILENLEIRGSVTVKAPGLVIRNSLIVGGPNVSSIGLVNNVSSKQPFTIVDSTLRAATADPHWNGIYGSNFTAERVNISNVVDPIRVDGSNVTVRDSWLHDNSYWAQDPLWNNTPSHDDSVQIMAGNNLVFEGNRIEGAHNAAFMISQAANKDVLGTISIRDNYIQGGSCTINIAATPTPVKTALTGNVFGPVRVSKTCAVISTSVNAPVMTGNIWEATGLPMNTYIAR